MTAMPAKNQASVAIVTDPGHYGAILAALDAEGAVPTGLRAALAVEAFRHTAAYDARIAEVLPERMAVEGVPLPDEPGLPGAGDPYPARLTVTLEKVETLRYGENPQQSAAFYIDPFSIGVSVGNSEKLHGKEISYNNILDLESALELLREFPDEPTAAVIKHTNPCGIASADTIKEAFVVAYDVDPLAAYGCVIGLNREVDAETAEQIGGHFVECVIAPGYSAQALAILTKKKNIRLLRTRGELRQDEVPEFKMKKVKGGLLVQTTDTKTLDPGTLKIVSKRAPTPEEVQSMLFAWKVCKHVWSNAIILAKGRQVVGIGAGQMSRVDSSMIAGHKAGEKARGSVMASDAFFPFRDGVDEAAKVGVTAVIQPGGSIRDEEVIRAANEHNMAMVFTGVRIFRH